MNDLGAGYRAGYLDGYRAGTEGRPLRLDRLDAIACDVYHPPMNVTLRGCEACGRPRAAHSQEYVPTGPFSGEHRPIQAGEPR